MGHRGWIIESNTKEQKDAIRKWYINVEREQNTDWCLRFYASVRRDNGSTYCLIDSDGSGCISHLDSDYGYQGSLYLLGECDEFWDDDGSPLGLISNATYSCYMDASDDEYCSEGSECFIQQAGEKAVLMLDNASDLHAFRVYLSKIAETSKLMPEISGDCYQVKGGVAKGVGLWLYRVSDETYNQLCKSPYSVSLECELDNLDELKRGFSLSPVEAYVWNELLQDYEVVPREGASSESLDIIAAKNERYNSKRQVELLILGALGYEVGGSLVGAGESRFLYVKEVAQSVGKLRLDAIFVQPKDGSKTPFIDITTSYSSDNEQDGQELNIKGRFFLSELDQISNAEAKLIKSAEEKISINIHAIASGN